MTSFAVTLFSDVHARNLRAVSMTLEEMAWHARVTTAPSKDRLPLWKLATFGNAATDKGSLRHDRNVIACTGVEADYDGEQIGFEEAVEIADKLGLRALVYTSPSHAAGRARWRVMCPAAGPMPPHLRRGLLGRLNGAYRGIFSHESWTLSQTYFFGSVAGNPAHRVEIVEGQPIDELDELDAVWMGPAAAPGGGGAAVAASDEARDDAELVRCIVTGEHLHVELCALAARYVGRGIAGDTVVGLLQGLMLSHAEASRDTRWADRYGSVAGLVQSAQAKFAGDAEARRAIASTTHRMARQLRPADDIRDAVLREAEQRGVEPERAVALAAAILRDKVEGRRHA